MTSPSVPPTSSWARGDRRPSLIWLHPCPQCQLPIIPSNLDYSFTAGCSDILSLPSQTKIRGPNSTAKIQSARNVVPHYSHFICKLAFTWSVSQLSLPQPVSLKDPSLRLATTTLSQSGNPPGTPNRLSVCLSVCVLLVLFPSWHKQTHRRAWAFHCFDSERPLRCPVFCQIS